MFQLKQTTPTGGDCTAGYDVILDKKYAFEEFINTVLSRNEWGTIYINKGNNYKYKADKLLSELNSDDLTKTVFKATCVGGWSMMDYYVETI
jgi:hypothetical protein